jgi:3-methyladenine DNA glycosylase/8-oxoguanine DNA glycosylase
VALRLRQENGHINAEAWGDGAALGLDSLPRLVGEADDDSDFFPHHPLIRDLHRFHVGLRLPRTGAVLNALVPVIVEQKVIGQEARAAYGRMIAQLGEPAPGPLGLTLPPSAATLAATPYWTFHRMGVEQRRADTIVGVARRATWVEALAALPPAEANARLQLLPGVGPWSAAKVALSALGDADAVPVGDYNLPHSVAWALAHQPRGSDDMMLELLEPYRGHRGRVIRLLTVAGIHAPRRGPRLPLRQLERH